MASFGAASHSYWQVAWLQVKPGPGGVVPQSAGHSHAQVSVLHCRFWEHPPQSARHSNSQISELVLQYWPAGGSPAPHPSAQSHWQRLKSHVEFTLGAAPGHAKHSNPHVVVLQVKPGGGFGSPQSAGQLQAQTPGVVSHTWPDAQPPQSSKHSGVHVEGLQVSFAGKPPGKPQSDGQTH